MGIFSAIYRKSLIHRYDDDHIVFHYSYKDFPGMEQRPVHFKSEQGHPIQGYVYSYPGEPRNELVIFCHGIGGGHRSYMREIELICRQGYEVLAYDNVGCWESGGSSIRGMAESINDLVACLDFVYITEGLSGRPIHLIGHSWGAYAVSNILNFKQRDIKSITAISSFASIHAFTETGKGFLFKAFKGQLMRFERKANPKYADSCSVDALNSAKCKVLLIHSKDDNMVDMGIGIDYIRPKVFNDNVSYIVVNGRHHNPNYTEDAVNYMTEVFGEYQRLIKSRKLRTVEQKKAFMADKDFNRMTMQDEKLWKKIFDHMEKA